MSKPEFIDLHSHFVFGLDDGARDLDETLAMVDQAASLNIKQLLATPHATDLTDDVFSDQLLRRFRFVKSEIEKAGIPVKLSLAAELFFSKRILEWFHYPWTTFDNNLRYLLFELPLYDLPDDVGDLIFQCRLKGITPILAHPERYVYLHDKLSKLYTWFQQGCLIQINAGSVTGQFGASIQNVALNLIKGRFVHFIASDAHETERRSYKTLIEARSELRRIVDEETLDALFYANPKKALNGETIKSGEVKDDFFAPRSEQLKRWVKFIKRRLFS
ncbi:MAG: hypothetical protein GXO77_14805 [Calditrichaeota bacterium]|nr:hypothetical protein [Calditrichota bacterium]